MALSPKQCRRYSGRTLYADLLEYAIDARLKNMVHPPGPIEIELQITSRNIDGSDQLEGNTNGVITHIWEKKRSDLDLVKRRFKRAGWRACSFMGIDHIKVDDRPERVYCLYVYLATTRR